MYTKVFSELIIKKKVKSSHFHNPKVKESTHIWKMSLCSLEMVAPLAFDSFYTKTDILFPP